MFIKAIACDACKGVVTDQDSVTTLSLKFEGAVKGRAQVHLCPTDVATWANAFDLKPLIKRGGKGKQSSPEGGR